jgi:hypothetical protein
MRASVEWPKPAMPRATKQNYRQRQQDEDVPSGKDVMHG